MEWGSESRLKVFFISPPYIYVPGFSFFLKTKIAAKHT